MESVLSLSSEVITHNKLTFAFLLKGQKVFEKTMIGPFRKISFNAEVTWWSSSVSVLSPTAACDD